MARTFGRIFTSILTDEDFCTLSESAQRLYLILLPQKDLDNAGLLSINYNRWARTCRGMTVERVREIAHELHERRYLLLDESTDEAMIRSFIRNDEVTKQPQIMKNALRVAQQLDSPYLRSELAAELRRLGRDDAAAVADQIDPGDPRPPDPNRSPIQADGRLTEDSAQGAFDLPDACAEVGVEVSRSSSGSGTSSCNQFSSSSDSASQTSDDDDEPTVKDEPQRDDVDALCFRLRDWMLHNEVKPPTIGKRWKQQARLLLDSDKRDLSKALNLIDWCQQHHFWKSNIHSIAKFRDQYDKLALQAREEWRRNGGRLALVPEPVTPSDPDAAFADLRERAEGSSPTKVGHEAASLIGSVFMPAGRMPGESLSELAWNRERAVEFIDANADRIREAYAQRQAG